MNIESTSSNGSFTFYNNGVSISSLQFIKWYSKEAEIKYLDSTIKIMQDGFWGTKYKIEKDEQNVGKITMNWKSDFLLEFNTSEKSLNYTLKCKGFAKTRFELHDDKGNIIIILHSNMNWKKFNYNYEVEVNTITDDYDINELISYCGYAANLYLAMMAGAV
ncbi:hypothetical protein [Sediminitomix flava]|uniref:Uncharacterized protein n=1 Tax=Sediminitomix flava TaxID=379075 RepID=A0A315Z8F5_SEDFL|nr:hypothetical protein [Sediminitomix flava]PWJ39980.1 hypothetical protein BC781_10543 [Sediminitomix flava]